MSNRKIAILSFSICLVITIYFFLRIAVHGFWIWGDNEIQFDKTGQVGDFIGGVVGTIISAAGFYFLYLTFSEQKDAFIKQREAFEKERFESKFFDLIKLQRENALESRYRANHGRKVFAVIFKEFLTCLREVRRYSNSKNPDDYIKPKYKTKLVSIIQDINPRINLYEMATVDIAFCIVFYGLSHEGEVVLRRLFQRKYVDPYIYKLINYMQLKPVKRSSKYGKWKKLQSLEYEDRIRRLDIVYENRHNTSWSGFDADIQEIWPDGNYLKYYGGHQHRLGHYFRHLFQCYKFLNSQSILSDQEKYFYGKILRAQLSTYEQALLFVDSISVLGMKWELVPDYTPSNTMSEEQNRAEKEKWRLISKYHLIKNLPGDKFLDIKFRKYYPKVKYEFFD